VCWYGLWLATASTFLFAENTWFCSFWGSLSFPQKGREWECGALGREWMGLLQDISFLMVLIKVFGTWIMVVCWKLLPAESLSLTSTGLFYFVCVVILAMILKAGYNCWSEFLCWGFWVVSWNILQSYGMVLSHNYTGRFNISLVSWLLCTCVGLLCASGFKKWLLLR